MMVSIYSMVIYLVSKELCQEGLNRQRMNFEHTSMLSSENMWIYDIQRREEELIFIYFFKSQGLAGQNKQHMTESSTGKNYFFVASGKQT